MTLDDTSGLHDPIAWLLMFVREAQRQQAALHDPATAAAALSFFQMQLPGYRKVLEQALFPLLKRRLRDDDDAQEETLRQAIFLASGTLLTGMEQLSVLTASSPPDTSTARDLMAAFSQGLDRHLEQMETIILPAVHTRLSACDIALLAGSQGRHATGCVSITTHPQENTHDAR
jgi:hypothetical protein